MTNILKINSTFKLKNLDYQIFNHINMKDILIFDIETTGFSREHTKVMLIGYVEMKDKMGNLSQLFCNSLSEEKEILIDFMNTISNYSYFMTYNGDAFDIPYLNARYKANGIDFSIDKSRNIDMLKFTRKHMGELQLDNYKLKSVERLLGINREDEISGKESVELYFSYLRKPNKDLLDKILLHNYDDIKNMYPLLGLTDYVTKKNLEMFLPKLINLYNKKMVLSSYLIKDYLFITLNSLEKLNDRLIEEFNYSLKIQNNIVSLKLPLISISIQNKELHFIDIEKLSELKFNELSSQEKMKYLVSIDNEIVIEGISEIDKYIYWLEFLFICKNHSIIILSRH